MDKVFVIDFQEDGMTETKFIFCANQRFRKAVVSTHCVGNELNKVRRVNNESMKQKVIRSDSRAVGTGWNECKILA